MLTRFLLRCTLTVLAGEAAPVPVEREPRHHVQLRNEVIEVIHVVLPPGESTLFHTHSHDRVAVDLTRATLVLQTFGQPEGPPEPTVPGSLSSRANADAPVTHRVKNVGTTPYEVVDVEFLHRPSTRTRTPAASDVGTDNPSARIQVWRLSPGETSALHTHSQSTLLLSVTRGRLTMLDAAGHPEERAFEPGDFRWTDAPSTHALRNGTASPLEVVELELK